MTLLSTKLQALDLSQEDISDRLGVSQSYISQVLKGKILKYNATKKFADAFGWNLYELLADFEKNNNSLFDELVKEDVILLKEDPIKIAKKKAQEAKEKKGILDEPHFRNVEAYVLPFKGRLGLGSSFYAEEYISELERVKLPVSDTKDCARYWYAQFEGDSMTNGSDEEIPSGSWVKLCERHKSHWNQNLKGRKIGFFDKNNNLTVKVVKEHNDTFKTVVLESLNPNKSENKDWELDLRDCYAVYDYLGHDIKS